MSDIQALLYQLRQIEVDVQPKQRLREIYGMTDQKVSRKRGRERETMLSVNKKVWRTTDNTGGLYYEKNT